MVLARSGTRGGYWLVVALVEVAVAVLAIGGALLTSAIDGPGAPSRSSAGSTPTASASAPAPPAGTAPVIVPGRPGESPQVLRPDQLSPSPAGPTYNAADVRFVRMMIPHHQQAIQMAGLAPQRAGSAGVIAVAERIRGTQQPEVDVLTGWLRDRGLTIDPRRPTGHDHEGMHGLQSAAEIAALTATTGTDFDRMFIDMMIEHHQGAIQMAQEVLTTGLDQQLRELARNIAFEQAVEVDRMRDLLARPTGR